MEDLDTLRRVAAQFAGGETPVDSVVEGITLANCIDRLLTAEAPDAPNWALWYVENVLLPVGLTGEAIRLLNERIKWKHDVPWNQRDYDAAMACLCRLDSRCFSD